MDLVNQWQLIAHLQDLTPHFGGKGKTSNDVLFAAMRDFDLTYAAYAGIPARHGTLLVPALAATGTGHDHRRNRSPRKPGQARSPAAAAARPSLPELTPGQRVRLAVEHMDELTLDIGCRYLETLAAADAADAAEETEAID